MSDIWSQVGKEKLKQWILRFSPLSSKSLETNPVSVCFFSISLTTSWIYLSSSCLAYLLCWSKLTLKSVDITVLAPVGAASLGKPLQIYTFYKGNANSCVSTTCSLVLLYTDNLLFHCDFFQSFASVFDTRLLTAHNFQGSGSNITYQLPSGYTCKGNTNSSVWTWCLQRYLQLWLQLFQFLDSVCRFILLTSHHFQGSGNNTT